jgi:heme exporter protein A
MSDTLLSADAVGRRFGYRPVFGDVTLSLRRGEALALIGPNGGGKTTLLRVLSGLLRPSSGAIESHGTLGFVAHHSMAYDALTAHENLTFAARLWGISKAARIDELLDQVGLTRARDQRVGTFSRGMTQRLAIARALLHDPDILLLDEPLNSLDEPGAEMVLRFMEDFIAREHAIAIVTHQFERVARVATSVGYLVGGSLDGPELVDGRPPTAVSEKYRSLLANA